MFNISVFGNHWHSFQTIYGTARQFLGTTGSISGNTETITVSLEQDVYLWKYWNNKCVSKRRRTSLGILETSVSLELLEQWVCLGTTGTMSVSLELLERLSSIPCRLTRDIPPRRTPPRTPQFLRMTVAAGSMLDGANREWSWLPSRFRHQQRDVGATTPEESGDGQWPGFSLRRGGPRPSAPRHRGSMVQRVPPFSERRHRPRPNTPAPLASSKSRPLPRESSATLPPGGPATTSTPTFVDHNSRTTAKTNVPTSAYCQFG